MPVGKKGFQKGDPNINRQGRPTADRLVSGVKTKRQKGEDDLHAVLRKLKPLNNIAIAKFASMLQNDDTSEAGKIRIAAFIFKEYEALVKQLYLEGSTSEEEQDDDEIVGGGAVLNLRVVDNSPKED